MQQFLVYYSVYDFALKLESYRSITLMDDHITGDSDSRAELNSYSESEAGTLNAHVPNDASTLTLSHEQNINDEGVTSNRTSSYSGGYMGITETNHDNCDGTESSENQIVNNDEDDPLHIRQLALNFDYLMYKIRDHTFVLSDAVVRNVDYAKRQQEVELSKISRRIREARRLIEECKRTNMEIDKLEQFKLLTRDFKQRLEEVNKRMNTHNKKYRK